MDSTSDDLIYANGIDGTTGEYALPPLGVASAADLASNTQPTPEVLAWLQALARRKNHGVLGPPQGVRLEDPMAAGWAIVFHPEENPEVRRALQPLIEHRRSQIGAALVKELPYTTPSQRDWLLERGVSGGSIIPDKVPYYLLIVGSPERIPFSFSQRLTTEYATGRLHLPTPADYAAYAEQLVRYETAGAATNAREVVFFAPRHPFDTATQLSADELIKPLAGLDPAGKPTGDGFPERKGFRNRALWGDAATKAALAQALAAPADELPPALLFAASHGLLLPAGHARQAREQGALVCQDWPALGGIEPRHYFAAADLPPEARVAGSVAFLFACYGGGVPQFDRFVPTLDGQPQPIAPAPFHSALPTALLTHKGGGVLAVIGHIERTWASSIMVRDAGAQLQPFQNAMGRILAGEPVGHALRDFYDRYAVTSTEITQRTEDKRFGISVPDTQLARLWLQRNDAEGYVVLGDPAARLRPDLLV